VNRLGFQWTDWSTPPVTATIVVSSWAITFLLVALLASALGFDVAARGAFLVAKALFAGAGALLAVAVVLGISMERAARRRARPVERPVHR
jgi:uncharacterized membrane protein YtjA (UPF0391 family)